VVHDGSPCAALDPLLHRRSHRLTRRVEELHVEGLAVAVEPVGDEAADRPRAEDEADAAEVERRALRRTGTVGVQGEVREVAAVVGAPEGRVAVGRRSEAGAVLVELGFQDRIVRWSDAAAEGACT
jgi:hypothetical protein